MATKIMVELQCTIEASSKPVKMKLPSAADWNKNVGAILKKIGAKFKSLKGKDEEWIMTVNDEFLDKTDPKQFGETLSKIKPPAKGAIAIKIIPKPKEQPPIQFTVEYKSKTESFLSNNMDLSATEEKEWNDNFIILKKEIELKFPSLKGKDYEIQDIDECDIGTDELQELYNDGNTAITLKIIYEEEEEEPEPAKPQEPIKPKEPQKPPKQIEINFEGGSLLWIPPKPNSNNDADWEENYSNFIEIIESKCNINKNDIEEIHDPNECGIDGGDELKMLWEDEQSEKIQVKILLKPSENDANEEANEIINDMNKNEIENMANVVKDKNENKSKDENNNNGNDSNEEEQQNPDDNNDKDKEKEKEKEKDKVKDADDGKDDGKDGGGDDSKKEEKKSDDDDSKGAGAATDPSADTQQQQEREQEEEVGIAQLLTQLTFNATDWSEILTELGSSVGLLGEGKKVGSFNALKGILEGAERGGAETTEQFQNLLNTILKDESQKYTKCSLQFIKLLGYDMKYNEEKAIIELKGEPDKKSLTQIKSNFHHLSNAMQKPTENIYQQLKISVPKTASVGFHQSGILDNKFITFSLPQIVLENQQSSLVNKNILDPGDFERFVNFLVPNSSKYLCKEIYFDKLKKLQVQSIGLFGSRREVLTILLKYNAISQPLYDVLKNDTEHRYLQPGIHAILPCRLQKGGNFNKWDGVIYLFYWSLPNSFDMQKMKAVKYMRKDPSCLLTRVLYEISTTVCIQVSLAELTDFGITYEIDEDGKEMKHDEPDTSSRGKKGRKKKRRKKRAGRRQKLNFEVEETKENMVMCNKCATLEEQLKTKTIRKDESWKHFKVGDTIGALDSTHKWYLAEVLRVKKKSEQLSEYGNNLKLWQQNQLWKFNAMEGVYIHYDGWSAKWNEWIFIDQDVLCNCITNSCTSFGGHRIMSKEKFQGKSDGGGRNGGRKKKKKGKRNNWMKQGGNWIQGAVDWVTGAGDISHSHSSHNINNNMNMNNNNMNNNNIRGLDDDDEGMNNNNSNNNSDNDNSDNDGNDDDDDDDGNDEFDIACDTFVLGGFRMSGYCQLFKQKERPDQNTEDETCWNTTEVKDFLTDLNTKYILEWQTSFVNKSSGIDFLAWAICNDVYKEFEGDKAKLDKEEQDERANDKIKLKVDEVLDVKHREILFEFHENYTSYRYCKRDHEEIIKILQSLDKNNALKPELGDAVAFAYIEPQPTTLPKTSYSWFRDTCLKKMETETKRILGIYRRKKKKNDHQRNLAIQNWFKLYREQLEYYKNNVYGGGRYQTSVLHRESIREGIEKKIKKEYNKKRRSLKEKLETGIKALQGSKPEDMKTTTLTNFHFKEKGFMNNSEKYTITYTIPTVIPPSYYMQFMSIDLPNTSEDLRIANMKNMRFEMPQTDTLIFHQMMGNGDTIMFIREDNEQTKETKTKIIASHSRVLTVDTKPLKVLKTKRVRMVAYCEAQKLFAILMHDVLGFCIFQDGGRISITNKRCELRDIAWWTPKLQYKAILVEEINKNIWVWLIDEKNIVRAFDYDAGSWDSAKEFELDQVYDSYQLSPKGSFLIAMKHQYEEDLIQEQKDSEEEQKNDDKVKPQEEQKNDDKNKVKPQDAQKSDDATKTTTSGGPGSNDANKPTTAGGPVDPKTKTPETPAIDAQSADDIAKAKAKADEEAKQQQDLDRACEDIITYPDTLNIYTDDVCKAVQTHEQHHIILLKFPDQKKVEWSVIMYADVATTTITGMVVDKYPIDIKLLEKKYKNKIPKQQPVDPNAKPVDPNAKPVDPNAKPVDPNAKPVDPNAKPVDPNAKAKPVDPNAKPVDVKPIIDMTDPNLKVADYLLPKSGKKLRFSEWSDEVIYKKILTLPGLSTLKKPANDPDAAAMAAAQAAKKKKEEEKKVEEEKAQQKKPTGRIELHAYLLLEKKKLEYVVHKDSLTGYETGKETEFKNTDKDKDKFRQVDNVLLPETYTTVDDYVKFDRIHVMESNKKDDMLLCTITKDAKLYYHPLTIQVSEARMRINEAKKKQTIRRITKLDYMEYMIEKFGSRAAIYYPEDDKLCLHTTYIMKEQAQNADKLCERVSDTICKSLEDKEKKNFKYLSWDCNVLPNEDSIDAKAVLKQVHNKPQSTIGNEWIKNLITQIPIQIARGSNNTFQLMYNGEDNQDEYVKATDAYSLCKAIRFGGYDGLIKSWEGDIKVVTSMGKQSTGKSYMLNHLFGTKFDISGGRCTDGGWLSVKVIDDILYVVCDFEGLGSFERSPQEDMLLATFNSAISNCTIFKCDNRFDRTVEDMFNKFQSGVKIMSGSQNCFTGELLLIIKDVVDTGAEAAVADFKRHIERLAQEAELVMNEKGKKQSSFFVSQMYQAGLEIIPFPPLANEAFFDELNDTLELAIDDIDIVHVGGKIFLDHIKLVMAKLHIGDFSAMSGEQAKIRSQEIRDNLQNAVEAGSIIQPSSTQYGVTFQVDDDQNLLLLDGNQILVIQEEDIVKKIKNYKQVIGDYSKIDINIEQTLLSILAAIDDAGLILGKVESSEFLWEQFSARIKRDHQNFKQLTDVYQLFLDLVFWRRKLRVFRFVKDNTKKFEDQEKHEIESLIQAADSRLNSIREKMKVCKQKCKECFYPCLLCKNHEDDTNWADDHTCYQTTHSCGELCDYCRDKGQNINCADKCGHSGKHNCRNGEHTCGGTCTLSKYGGCQTKCNLESGHNKTNQPCKCAAETHYCIEKCGIKICKNNCKIPYTKQHNQHICIQQSCPYKCQVQCWNDSLKTVTACGRPCSSDEHDHELKLKNDNNESSNTTSSESKDDDDEKGCPKVGHTCDQEHPCPEYCTELGNCRVEIQRKIVEKETLVTGAGAKIEYDSYAEVNAEKKRCCKKIPVGLFQHAGSDHKCYDGNLKDNLHTCEEKCDACGYFCQNAFNHYQDKGSFHDCVHGNMRNTVFYATEEIVDTGENRKYKVGDAGVAEMCNIFCERTGRGHIHLEICEYEEGKCVEEEGRRHQSKEYMPNPKKAKDEVKHSKFWRRKKWNDPCVEKFRKIFDKCNFECQHQVHIERAQRDEDDEVKWCVEPLWHKPMNTPTGHTFNCKHPFSDCHVIFLCDISGSMDSTDGGASQAQFTFIRDAPRLNNRLGALYSAIHNFMDVRLQKGCVDCVSAVMFNGHCTVAARMENATPDFVQNFLLKFTPSGGTNFGAAFNGAKDLCDDSQDSVLIFLTDGESSDNGSSNIVADLSNKLGKKFQLFCILLGTISERGNPVVEGICNAGNGTLLSSLSGNELGQTFTTIAKQMNAGAFGAL